MRDDIITRYTSFLIKQYWEKPKARAEIQWMMNHWQRIADFIRDPSHWDLDLATGYRLDVIGRIVGLPREVPEALAKIFFGFYGHQNSDGFDQKVSPTHTGAPFYSKFSKTYDDYQLNDSEYRRFLKVKIAKNAASATISSDDGVSLQDVIQAAFDGQAYVTDMQDMTIALSLMPAIKERDLQLIIKLDLLPKPAGVKYQFFYQIFGFADNPMAKGLARKSDTTVNLGGALIRKTNG